MVLYIIISVHLNLVIAVHSAMCFPGKLSGTRGMAGTESFSSLFTSNVDHLNFNYSYIGI